MATAQAYQKYIHQSPRKLRLVADMIRGKEVNQALSDLAFTPKKAARLLRMALVQAKANALQTDSDKDAVYNITNILIEEGPRLKRYQPVSRGRAHSILKRMSHIKIILGSIDKPKASVKGKS